MTVMVCLELRSLGLCDCVNAFMQSSPQAIYGFSILICSVCAGVRQTLSQLRLAPNMPCMTLVFYICACVCMYNTIIIIVCLADLQIPFNIILGYGIKRLA
jgi:hypothetical protein